MVERTKEEIKQIIKLIKQARKNLKIDNKEVKKLVNECMKREKILGIKPEGDDYTIIRALEYLKKKLLKKLRR